MQGTRASGAIVLTLVYVIVAYSVEEGPTHTYIYIYILGQNGIFYMELRKKVVDNQIWIWNQHKYVWVALA